MWVEVLGVGATQQEHERGAHGIRGTRGAVLGLNHGQDKPPRRGRENSQEGNTGRSLCLDHRGLSDLVMRSHSQVKTSQNHSTDTRSK